MSGSDVKLKIALEALLRLKNYARYDGADVDMRIEATEALRSIEREHYLGEPSPVVHEVLAGIKSL